MALKFAHLYNDLWDQDQEGYIWGKAGGFNETIFTLQLD